MEPAASASAAASVDAASASKAARERRPVERHLAIIRAINAAPERSRRLRRDGVRGVAVQQPFRDVEARLRRRALALVRVGAHRGLRRPVVADAIGVDPDLLSRWEREAARRFVPEPSPPVEPRPLGRKPLPEPADRLRRMRNLCRLFGPGMGARSLRDDFPDASWRTCWAITRQCRLEIRDQLRTSYARACTWTTPGTVWAADVWKTESPIDGEFRCVLDVRDLATGFIITSEPLEQPTAAVVGEIFDRLYRHLRPPLVCKTDNGSEFLGEGSWEVHHRYGVEQLLSPVELPSYNGACEAGHGSMQYRSELLARRDGRSGDWSLNHLAGARDWANSLVDERRPVSPSHRFTVRPNMGGRQRLAFRQAVLANKLRRRDELAQRPADGRGVIDIAHPTITRPAIAEALRDLGYLDHRSVPIRQHIPWLKSGSISL